MKLPEHLAARTIVTIATQRSGTKAFAQSLNSGALVRSAYEIFLPNNPVASLTRLGGQQEGQRYQHCTLCSAQWHVDRVRCTHCGAAEGLQYLSLQAVAAAADDARKRPAVEAETCGQCGHYLKIMHAASDLHVEPVADDLATLTLDLLVSDAGYQRHGTNLLLLFGDSEPIQPEPA